MLSRLDKLIKEDYSIDKFSNLSTPYQLAIVWFMAVDGDAWDGVDLSTYDIKDLKLTLPDLLVDFVSLYGDVLIGSVILKSVFVIESIMSDVDIADEFASWEEYHSFYLRCGDIPEHSKQSRWPVMLSNDDCETLRDGWHRFHSYMRDGDEEVSAFFFPSE